MGILYGQKVSLVFDHFRKPLVSALISLAMELPRDEIESNLEFIGFITFKNNLKRTSCDVIRKLKIANLKSIMITGDYLETAVSVSKEVGIIDQNHQDGLNNFNRFKCIRRVGPVSDPK